MNQGAQQLWTEVGCDLQYDARDQDDIMNAEDSGVVLDNTETCRSGRAFAGYPNSINDRALILAGPR